MILRNLIIFLCACSLYVGNIISLQEARSSATEDKFKMITYNPHAIHKYIGYYEKAAVIIFEEGEIIDNIFMGDPTGWQLVPRGHKLFLKPVGDNCQTNVLIETSKRSYWMEFDAMDVEDATSEADIVYELRFMYAEAAADATSTNTTVFLDTTIPSFKDLKSLNFHYSISGSEKIAPTLVFDNGQFTFLKFKVINTDMPAIFRVNNRAEESLINYKIVNEYLVIESVDAVYTLRFGEEVACLFNETLPIYNYNITKRKKGIFG